MQKLTDDDSNSSNLAKIAATGGRQLRNALCDTELKECQRKLKEHEIKGVLPDADKLRATMKARSIVYGRMADLYSINEDRSMAGYYRLLADAIRVAVAQGELSQSSRTAQMAGEPRPQRQKQRRESGPWAEPGLSGRRRY